MGTFLITNFPTAGCSFSGPTVRDQFGMLESLASMVGVLHVKLAPMPFAECCSPYKEDYEAYEQFDAKVYQQLLVQYGNAMICDAMVDDGKDADAEAAKVAASFHSFTATAS